MSFPATLDSRFLTASLGYLRTDRQQGAAHPRSYSSVCDVRECETLLWWSQHLLQVLLYFIHIRENISLEGEEWRMCSWGQIVKVGWFPEHIQCHQTAHSKYFLFFYT